MQHKRKFYNIIKKITYAIITEIRVGASPRLVYAEDKNLYNCNFVCTPLYNIVYLYVYIYLRIRVYFKDCD